MQIVSAKYHSVDIDSGLPNRLSAYDENGQRYGIDPNDQLAMQRFGVQAWIDAGNTVTPYSAPVKTWEENRQAEYPKIEELVVALYDTDDKAALEKRRSDVKAKYPKPE
tara:strand:- start:451 stop:777 length:327 start_codon:yes stop_codon:yes gene_type:complete